MTTKPMFLDDSGETSPFSFSFHNNFDVLRLLFAYTVAVYHLMFLSGLWKGRGIFGIDAGLAVDGFFVISGFLITWSLDRDPSVRNYTFKRFFRIYPLYFLVVIVQCYLLMMLLNFDFQLHLKEMLRYLFCNLLFAGFLQSSIAGALSHLRVDAINGSLWTLKLEVIFYLLLPVFLLLYRRCGGIALVIPYLALGLIDYKIGSRYAIMPSNLKNLLEFQFFFVGIGFYFYGRHLMSLKHYFPVIGFLSLLLLVYVHYFNLRPVPLAWEMARPFMTGLAVFCLAFSASKLRVKYDLSYGVYILHYPLVQMALGYGLFRQSPFYLFLIAVLATVTLLAWLSFRFVERPFIRLARRLTRPAEG